jgi:hypothetical protein
MVNVKKKHKSKIHTQLKKQKNQLLSKYSLLFGLKLLPITNKKQKWKIHLILPMIFHHQQY